MSEWKKYFELEPIRRLRNEGRELVGKTITLTEKRDGENVSIWLDETNTVRISSHNLIEADGDIITRFKATKEYQKAVTLLTEEQKFNRKLILYGELLKLVGPTRIEPKRKHTHWILFDVWDCKEERYLSYTQLYQVAYHYRIPIVKCIDLFAPSNIDELNAKIQEVFKWCKRHRREGVVGKDYENQVFFKEKIDLPKLPKIQRQPHTQLPEMPEERILRALQHAYDEVGSENWKNVKVAMPIVAKYFEVEAKEHNYSAPHNMYKLYLEIPISKLVEEKHEVERNAPDKV